MVTKFYANCIVFKLESFPRLHRYIKIPTICSCYFPGWKQLRLRLFAILITVAISCIACTPEPAPILRIGTFNWTGYEPLWLAQELGYTPESSIRLVEFYSATQVIQAYQNGAIDAATLTLDEVLLLASYKQEPQIVLALDFSNGADVILAKPEFKSLVDLKGRRIGVENTALGAYMLHRALHSVALAPTDVQIVSLPINEHAQAYKENLVDAVVTFPPMVVALLAAGAHKVFDSSQIPGEIMDVLVVRKEYLKKHTDVLPVLITGWFRTLEYLRQHPDDAAQRMAKREKISTQDFMLSLKGLQYTGVEENRALFSNQAQHLKARIKSLEAMMLSQHLLSKPINPIALIDGTAIQRVLHEPSK